MADTWSTEIADLLVPDPLIDGKASGSLLLVFFSTCDWSTSIVDGDALVASVVEERAFDGC